MAVLEELAVTPRKGVAARRLSLFLVYAGALLLSRGDRERAEALWREQAELAVRTQVPNALNQMIRVQTLQDIVQGRLEAAVDTLQMARDRDVQSASPFGAWYAFHPLARALLYLGRAPEALDALAHLRNLNPVPETLDDAVWEAVMSAHRSGHADISAQLRVVEERPGVSARILALLLEAAVLLKDREASRQLRDRLDGVPPLVAPYLNRDVLLAVGRIRGDAAAFLREPEQARAFYEETLELCKRIEFRPEIALIRLGLAEVLFEHYPDERAAARDHLDFALQEFEAMHMQPSLERALKLK